MSMTLLGLHVSNENHQDTTGMLKVLGTGGPVTILHKDLYSDRAPGGDWYDALRSGSDRLIHVRCYTPDWTRLNPREWARAMVDAIPWKVWADPRCIVSALNEPDIERPVPIGFLPSGQRAPEYGRIGRFDVEFWDEVDVALQGRRRCLASTSPLAGGHDMTPGVPDSEYTHPDMRRAIERCDVIGIHTYALLDRSKGERTTATGADRFYYMLRPWRKAGSAGSADPGGVLEQYPNKLGFVSEVGTFAHSDESRAAENLRVIEDFVAYAGRSARVLGATLFVWETDDAHPTNKIRPSRALVAGLVGRQRMPVAIPLPLARKATPFVPTPVEAPTVIEGIDVSRWQGKIDWRRVKQTGVKFAFIKATEGTSWVDPNYARNAAGAAEVGLATGAYHYYRNEYDPVKQARWFVQTAPVANHDLPHVVDVEDTKSPIDPAKLRACLQEVERLTGVRPIIYTGRWYWTPERMGGRIAWAADYPLWLADYSAPHVPPDDWPAYTILQYTSKADGRSRGVESQYLDLNRFAGTLDDLLALGKRPDVVGTDEDVARAMWAAAAGQRLLRFNPKAALFKTLKEDGLEQASNEFEFWLDTPHGRDRFVGQIAWSEEGLCGYYVRVGEYDAVYVDCPESR